MNLHPIWNEYPELAGELRITLALMEDSIKLKNHEVQRAIIDMIHAGGKLLRPAYQLLFAQFGPEQDPQKKTALAASIEMLHTATLIHDDIVDDSDLRRGRKTIKASFGNDVAVYAGDYLFVSCFKLLADYSGSLRSLKINSRSMEKILNGELGQMSDRYNWDLTIDAYLKNISGKTAELFALSCGIGALESGTTQAFSKKCSEIGEQIGLAFQIIDDILDYSADADSIGKPVLEDMRQGVYSLPLLYALKTNRAELLPLLSKKTAMTDADLKQVYQLVKDAQGVSSAHKLAEDYTRTALKNLAKLPDTPQQTKEQLIKLTKTILDRRN